MPRVICSSLFVEVLGVLKILSNLSIVSGATLLSRILGLVRDVLFFSIFGISVFGEAFLLAFTFPNLFRRMLGEGTLTSALIPCYSSSLKSGGADAAFLLLNQVFSRLFCLLGVLSLLVCGVLAVCFSFGFFSDPKWVITTQYSAITFSYVLLVCSSAVLVGVLNVQGRFLEGAVSPVILNICMICALTLGFVPQWFDSHRIALMLCVSILVAGVFQLIYPWFQLGKHTGWKWNFTLRKSEELSHLGRLFWTGAVGAAVAQLNILISRMLAYTLEEEGGLAFLYLSARLVELPLGVFAIAVSTVLFPLLAKSNIEKDKEGFEIYFFKGLRLILSVTIPAAVGLCLLAEPILRLLFEWKAFGYSDVIRGTAVLQVSSWTVPLYALSSFLVKVHHSMKNMSIPLRAAGVSLVSNLILSLILMPYLGVVGLAWANLIAALLQVLTLSLYFPFLKGVHLFQKNKISLGIPLLGSLLLALLLSALTVYSPSVSSKVGLCLKVCSFIFAGIGVYWLFLYFTKFPELPRFRRPTELD